MHQALKRYHKSVIPLAGMILLVAGKAGSVRAEHNDRDHGWHAGKHHDWHSGRHYGRHSRRHHDEHYGRHPDSHDYGQHDRQW
jgi:hypothetical protein